LDANTMRAWMALAAAQLREAKDYLTELDAAIGDADHGINIARGFAAVAEKIGADKIGAGQSEGGESDLGVLCKQVGMTLMSAVGGASGMLYGNFFLRAGAVAAGKQALDGGELLAMLQAGSAGIVQRGRAEVGDKTMVDVWAPALDALAAGLAGGDDAAAALAAAVRAAAAGRDGTIPLQARKGRASYLGPRSAGHMDPGAASSYILLHALHEAVMQTQSRESEL
jgi:dihydroxyacetone kinase-like protein